MVPDAEVTVIGQQLFDHEISMSKSVGNVHAPGTLGSKLLLKAGATMMAACLFMGLVIAETVPEQFHDAARILSVRTNASENVSIPKQSFGPLPPGSGGPPVFRQGVNTLCMCNLSPQKVYMIIDAPANNEGQHWSAGGYWVWNRKPCDCISAAIFQRYTQEGGTIQCSFRREDTPLDVKIPCSGRSFTYLSTSELSGRYACSGSPPTCAYSGYCQKHECWQTY